MRVFLTLGKFQISGAEVPKCNGFSIERRASVLSFSQPPVDCLDPAHIAMGFSLGTGGDCCVFGTKMLAFLSRVEAEVTTIPGHKLGSSAS